MKPISKVVEKLLRHYAGLEDASSGFSEWPYLRPHWLPPELPEQAPLLRGRDRRQTRQRRGYQTRFLGPTEAKEEFRLLEALKQSFAKKEFSAAVCFIDMVRFTERACGKSPKEVAGLAAPFLRAVIAAANENHCFVDKTIGDEVMVVMPVFPKVQPPLNDLMWFLAAVIRHIEEEHLETAFRAGIALGQVFLDHITAESYHEWSVFGNCVNGAKRLQTLPARAESCPDFTNYRAVLGAVDAEKPNFLTEVTNWLNRLPAAGPFNYPDPLRFLEVRTDCEELKGVGRMCFLDAYLSPTVHNRLHAT